MSIHNTVKKSSTIHKMREENFDKYLKLIKNTLTERGTKYDDAFHKTWEEWELDATRILLTIKLNRLKNLKYNQDIFDTIQDTLIDIAGYCVLSLIEIDREKKIKYQ